MRARAGDHAIGGGRGGTGQGGGLAHIYIYIYMHISKYTSISLADKYAGNVTNQANAICFSIQFA